ncbi:MAG: D-alanine--D-alanine ligase [Candidatus Cloacimonadota bacterium]|nr:MAG: D-alanine--D-alanine ligase [Candidatus Cloacimonadota bacterium]
MADAKPKIALLVGGTSPEREVSKMSGAGVYKALLSLQYPTVLVDPAYGTNQPPQTEIFFSAENYSEISNRNCVEAINSELFDDVEVVFSALHGKWAEDGTMQSLLELRELKYTGSKVLASALAMDKILSKTIFKEAGVNTAKWMVVTDQNKNDKKLCELIVSEIGLPCVIKSNDQGSTVGLTIVKEGNKIAEAVQLALKFSDKALVEEYIPGREITVTILEGKALPVLEIIPKDGFYDYERKYTPGMCDYIVPAEIPDEVLRTIQEQALIAFNSLGCESYGRVDFRLNENNESFCLEVNTLPGMTSTSLVPKMAKAVGISFEELIEKIINHAL